MPRRSQSRIATRCLLAATLPIVLLPAITNADISWVLEAELVAVLETKVAKLEKGQRGTFSKAFKKVGEDTYRVAFTRDTAGEERMTTERFLLTLRKAASRWEVTDEELQDTYEGLVRGVPGDEKFYRFSSLAIHREGLEITASDGTFITDFVLGEVDQIRLSAADLRYEYTPAQSLGRRRDLLYEQMKQERSEDFVFDPELVVINCDPSSCRQFLETAFSDVEEIGLESLDSTLRGYFDEVQQERREARKKNSFSGFELLRAPDRRRYSVHVKKQDADHWLVLRYDTRTSWEFRFSATGYGTLYGYPSAESLASVEPYAIERRDDFGGTAYDLRAVKGTVELATEKAELLKGDIEFTLRLKRELRELPFSFGDLSGAGGRRSTDRNPSITIDALQTGDGEDLTWVRFGTSSGIVVLPETAPAGSEVVLRMKFQNEGSIAKLSPSYSYMDRGGWLPFVRYTDKIEEFDLTVEAPVRYKVLGVGTKVSEDRLGKITRTRWVANSPVNFPTIIFGDYFEDAPKTRAEKSDGTEIPVHIHVDRDGMRDWAIRPKQLRPLAEQAVNALNIFRELYGVDYPYGKLDLVNDPQFVAGQAPASIVYLGSGAFRSEATLSSFVTAYGNLAKSSESLVAHEVAHQWWGSLIGNANANNYWFVESLAEYSAALFLEIMESEGYAKPEKGRKAYLEHLAGWRNRVMDNDLMCSVQDARTLWSNRGYSVALYSKGPYVFHILRSTFGDEKFFHFLKTLGQELAGKEIVTRDIQRVAERAFGGVNDAGDRYNVDLEWFFDQWIRGVGLPEYTFAYDYRKTEDGSFVIEGEVIQRVVVGKKKQVLPGVYFRGIVPITVVGQDKQEYSARLVVQGRETPFGFKVPVKPLQITLNKNGEILAHDVRDRRDE